MAEKVREFRKLIRMNFESEAEFAKAIGVDRRMINKVTNGHRIPTLADLQRYSAPLQTSVGDLAEIFLRNESPNGQRQ